MRVNGHLAESKIDLGAEVTVVLPSFLELPAMLDEVEAQVALAGNFHCHFGVV